MAIIEDYIPIGYQDDPIQTTPRNSDNMNKTDEGVRDNRSYIKTLDTNVGDLTTLETTEKTSLVGAINEVNENSIIESGDDTGTGDRSRGRYYKYSDGTLICTNRYYISSSINISAGSVFKSPVITLSNYMIPFISKPHVTMTYEKLTWGGESVFGVYMNDPISLDKLPSIVLMGANSISSSGGFIHTIAVGRWK